MISYNLIKVEVIKEEKTANATAGPSTSEFTRARLKRQAKKMPKNCSNLNHLFNVV